MNPWPYSVRSNPETDFTEALAINAMSAIVELQLPSRSAYWLIQGFSLEATQNLSYELWLFETRAGHTGVIGTDSFVSAWQFNPVTVTTGTGGTFIPSSPGAPVVGDSLDPYLVDGNMTPYIDLDQCQNNYDEKQNSQLHIALINRGEGAKNADAGGAVKLIVFCADYQRTS